MPDDVRLCVVAKGDNSIAIPNVVRWCVQSMVYDNMPRPTSSDCVCCPRALMVFHARHYSTLSMLFKGDHGLRRPTSFDRVFWKLDMMACLAFRSPTVYVIPSMMMAYHATSCHRVCYPRAKMECHARRHQTACASQ